MRFERRISSFHIAALGQIFGDRNPLHADSVVAQAAGFDRPIAHGAILVCLLSEIMGTQLGFGTPICCGFEISFEQPFYEDDLLNIDVEARHRSAALAATTYAFTVRRGADRVARGGFLVKELAPSAPDAADGRGAIDVAKAARPG